MLTCEGCKFNCKTSQDVENVERTVWNKEKKFYWWYITSRMKKVVYMGELQKDHTERCLGVRLIRV